jgi:hypothetical protein
MVRRRTFMIGGVGEVLATAVCPLTPPPLGLRTQERGATVSLYLRAAATCP